MPLRLQYSPLERAAGQTALVKGLKRPPLTPSWPWRATLLTAVNCYLLWGFTWFQFVITLSCLSYDGSNLWFHVLEPEPLGMTIPKSFLAFSVALSFFALGAVIGSTWRTPRLWKRALTVGIFATIVVGFSSLNLHSRHLIYDRALIQRDVLVERYQRNLSRYRESPDPWLKEEMERNQEVTGWYDESIRMYRDQHGLPQEH